MILATILHLPPGSPWILEAGAALLLVLHIGGGLVGIASGGAALVLAKGGRWHRLAGNAFFISMLCMAGVGAAVSPLIHQPGNSFGALLAFYLVATGWATVRRKPDRVGQFELGAMLCAAVVAAALLAMGVAAAQSPTGEIAGVPAVAPLAMGAVAALAAGSDLSVILRHGLHGAQRLARHLWRLSAALLIASGSLFIGQPKVRGSPIMVLPELFVFGMMLYWLVRLALTRRNRRVAQPLHPSRATA
jgi:uncharacterized membrane protein